MKTVWYKKYWQIGFLTQLYDLLAPEAYLHCIRRSLELAPDVNDKVILDAGCGSGLLLNYLQGNYRYLGIDRLWSGAKATSGKVMRTSRDGLVVRSDLLNELVLKENSVDVIFALFLVYTIPDSTQRKTLLRNLRYALKPGGKLILANPSNNYVPENIIRASLAEVRKRDGYLSWLFNKNFIYPLTLELGLRHVQHQIHSGAWHGYSPDELTEELMECGFRVIHLEPAYADCAYLVLGE